MRAILNVKVDARSLHFSYPGKVYEQHKHKTCFFNAESKIRKLIENEIFKYVKKVLKV